MPNIIEQQRQWPVIDRVYANLTLAQQAATTDNVPIGRFILIKYSDAELTSAHKLKLMTDYSNISLEAIPTLEGISDVDKEFLYNWRYDTIHSNTGGLMKDRLVLQKNAFYDAKAQTYIIEYKEIAYLTWTDLGEANSQIVVLQEKIGEVPENTNLTDMIQTEMQTRKDLQDRVETFLDGDELDATIDTLYELNNWIATHGNEFSGVLDEIDSINQELDDAQVYSNSIPLRVSLGGIEASKYPNGFTDKPIKEILDELLYPYIQPTINKVEVYDANASAWKSHGATYNKASETAKITKVRFSIGLGSKELVEIKVGEYSLTPENGKTNYEFPFPAENIVTATTSWLVSISDGEKTINNTLTLNFYYPSYSGVITQSTAIIESNLKDNLTLEGKPSTNTKRNRRYTRDNVNQCLYYAYPAEYGTIKKIIDPNGFTQVWDQHTIIMHGQNYYVYVSGNASGDNNSLYQFEF